MTFEPLSNLTRLDLTKIEGLQNASSMIVATPANRQNRRALDSVTGQRKHELATRYAKTVEPAVEGQNGNNHTFIVALYIRDLGIDEAECYIVLVRYFNPRCSPPWSDQELRAIVRNAYAYAKSEPLNTTQALLFTPNANTLRAHCAANYPAIEYYVNGLWQIPKGIVMLFVGAGGLGKTSLLLQISVEMAAARPILGGIGYVKSPLKVMYITVEDDIRFMMQTVNTILDHGGYTEKEKELALDNLVLVCLDSLTLTVKNGHDIQDSGAADQIIEAIESYGQVDILMLETVSRLNSGDENSNRDMSLFITCVEKISKAIGCTIILVHHTVKHPTGGDRNERGAGVISDNSRMKVSLHKGKDEATLILRVDKSNYTQSGHSITLRKNEYRILSCVDPVTLKHERDDPLRTKILEIIKSNASEGRYFTKTSFIKQFGLANGELGVNDKRLGTLIDDMLADNILAYDSKHGRRKVLIPCN